MGSAPVFESAREEPLDAKRLLHRRQTLPLVPMGHAARTIRC